MSQMNGGDRVQACGWRSVQAHGDPEMPRLPPGAFTLTASLSGLDLNSGRGGTWPPPRLPLCAPQLMPRRQRGPWPGPSGSGLEGGTQPSFCPSDPEQQWSSPLPHRFHPHLSAKLDVFRVTVWGLIVAMKIVAENNLT